MTNFPTNNLIIVNLPIDLKYLQYIFYLNKVNDILIYHNEYYLFNKDDLFKFIFLNEEIKPKMLRKPITIDISASKLDILEKMNINNVDVMLITQDNKPKRLIYLSELLLDATYKDEAYLVYKELRNPILTDYIIIYDPCIL